MLLSLPKCVSWIALLSLVLFASCSSNKQWTYCKVASSTPSLHSNRLKYISENNLTGIGVEFLTGTFGTLGYLSVSSREIPPLKEDPSGAVVVLEIEKARFPFRADRMEGGQRLLLPEEATTKLIETLQQGQPATLYLDGFREKIEPSNFAKRPSFFNRLRHIL